MMKLHLDTDIGGDIDDFCALAMLLRMPNVELTGITTVAELGGKRAGYARHVLDLEERADVPVAAGADVALGRYRVLQTLLDEMRYWGGPIQAAPNPLDQALDLLKASIEQGAAIAGIGPFTNLYFLDKRYPGILDGVPLYLMGGYVFPIAQGFPMRSNESDYNIQVDAEAAHYVIEHSKPTLVPLTVTVETALRRADLDSLRNSDALARLVARQAEEYARDADYENRYGKTCPRVPPDLINFQHDPLACAIAAGWRDGVAIEQVPIRLEMRDGYLHEIVDQSGKPTRLVTRIDGKRFDTFWLDTVCA